MSDPGSFGTILVVDDKERNIEVVGTTLATALGCEIIPATNGEQALARVAARAPDLILLGILMPGMDGFEVYRQLRADPITAAIPVIFVSAASEKSVIVEALEVGGVDYVTKPFNRAELRARVKTHLELKHARDQLHRIVEQREELMGMLAHDLKNPLFAVRLSSQMLTSRLEGGDDEITEMAARIHEGTERAFEFIDGFLLKAAADRTDIPVNLIDVDLAECVESAVANHVEHARRKHIAIQWARPSSEAHANTAPSALGDALNNLLSNALKFSKRETSVWITLDPDLPSISVRDQGPGFTEGDKEKLFQRFVRLSARPTGGETSTGLGLSIAKKLVDLIGGELSCESGAGSGATFTIKLPANAD